MSFINAPSIVSYTAIAGQTVFEFGFKWYQAEDITVFQIPKGEPGGDAYIVDPGQYTITAVGANIGGSITLNTGAALDDNIVIQRILPVVRTVEYAFRGSIKSGTLNDDQDYQTYLLQDFVALSNLMFKVPPGNIDTTFPAPVPDAYIKYNAAGDALEADETIPEGVIRGEAAATASETSAVESATSASESAESAALSGQEAQRSEDAADDAEARGQLEVWDAEAEALTAESYTTEAEDVLVKDYSSNGDGTFSFVSLAGTYSALHYSIKAAQSSVGLEYQSTWDTSTGAYPTTKAPEGTGQPLEAGDLFVVDVAGTISTLDWHTRDWMIRDATNMGWDRVPQVVDWSAILNVPTNLSNPHPVGSVLLRMDTINPETLFGGTWELITGDASLSFGDGSLQDGIAIGTNEPIVPLSEHSHANTATFTGNAMGNHSHTIPFNKSSTKAGGNYAATGVDSSAQGTTAVSAGTPAGNVSVSNVSAGTAGATLDVRGARIYINVWKRVS